MGGSAQTTLIGLSGGGAFVQEIRHGSGGVLLFTSALDGRWNDLPTRGLFVPLLHRSLFYLTSPEGDGARVADPDPRAILVPADGKVSECGHIGRAAEGVLHEDAGHIVQAKGRGFTVAQLLADLGVELDDGPVLGDVLGDDAEHLLHAHV